jgi:hypothetical protein
MLWIECKLSRYISTVPSKRICFGYLFVCLLLTCVGSERAARQLYERHIVENARCIVGGVRNKHLGAQVWIMCLTGSEVKVTKKQNLLASL